ncbi:hypothetical protein HDU93_009074 [Gonapodya sp. JEL0774]|nr:hypothetical protein HDU93_009074 [Gonapodya sp. JEL0774]
MESSNEMACEYPDSGDRWNPKELAVLAGRLPTRAVGAKLPVHGTYFRSGDLGEACLDDVVKQTEEHIFDAVPVDLLETQRPTETSSFAPATFDVLVPSLMPEKFSHNGGQITDGQIVQQLVAEWSGKGVSSVIPTSPISLVAYAVNNIEMTEDSSAALKSEHHRVQVKVYDQMRISKFWNQHRLSNTIIFITMLLVLLFFVIGVISKYRIDSDNLTEVFKLILVGLNGVTFCVILLQKRQAIWQNKLLTALLLVVFALFFGALGFNANILGIRFSDAKAMAAMASGPAETGDTDGDDAEAANGNDSASDAASNPYGFNSDYLTLSLTLLIDLVYLVLYFVFRTRTKRILLITIGLILIEIAMFVAASKSGNDFAIDTVNLITPVVTAALSAIFWTGVIVNQDYGQMFYDFYERLDLLGPEEKGAGGDQA